MKKRFLLLICMLCLVVCAACGKISEVVQAELADKLNSEVAFSEPLLKLESAEAEKRFYLNPNEYSEITAYVGTKATCDEFVIIRSSQLDNVESKLRGHLATMKSNYSSYRPNEAQKTDSAVIARHKDTIVMIVSGDSEKAKMVFEEYLKK